MSPSFGPRRAVWLKVDGAADGVDRAAIATLERYDLYYRTLVSVMFNFTQSGHPGGSISAGRIITALLLDSMEYQIGDPVRSDADIIAFAAGHKALGLYATLALRDEAVRLQAPGLLPGEDRLRLRLEDLLGFRRNPTQSTPLFREFGSKALDGHPTPATPFVKIATGPSGVGVGSALGLAMAAADLHPSDSPMVHIIEGEGGLTPGRVTETVAFAGSARLRNAVIHLDWNQASIDSEFVTREGDRPGEYVQWDPMEFFHLHDWNVIEVADGFDFRQVIAAQRLVAGIETGQPTAIVYRTVKGWRYGIEGRRSHGGGHAMGSDGYQESVRPLFGDIELPRCDPKDPVAVEAAYWSTLQIIRRMLGDDPVTGEVASRVEATGRRLDDRERKPRPDAPDVEAVFEGLDPAATPAELMLESGSAIALRQQLGKALGYLNTRSGGAILIAAADLLGSTAIADAAAGFDPGPYDMISNPGSRTLPFGICEDGLMAVMTGVSGFGHHMGAGASYGAFIAPLGHIAARVHAISDQMRQQTDPGPLHPVILVSGHAGMKTGEDGPTHADPQALQLYQENFVAGTAVTLTPWEPSEVWPLLAAALEARPSVIVPFVTRPSERVPDREGLGLAPAAAAAGGLYRLRTSAGTPDGHLVIQGSEVAYAFVVETMPLLEAAGIDLDVFLVTSAELFDRCPPEERREVFPEEISQRAMGITGFTLPTMYRWVRSDLGRAHTLHPFHGGHYLGSGSGDMVVHEAGLDGDGQFAAIKRYLEATRRTL